MAAVGHSVEGAVGRPTNKRKRQPSWDDVITAAEELIPVKLKKRARRTGISPIRLRLINLSANKSFSSNEADLAVTKQEKDAQQVYTLPTEPILTDLPVFEVVSSADVSIKVKRKKVAKKNSTSPTVQCLPVPEAVSLAAILPLAKQKRRSKESSISSTKTILSEQEIISPVEDLPLAKSKKLKKSAKKTSTLLAKPTATTIYEVISSAEILPPVKQKKRAKKCGTPLIEPYSIVSPVSEVFSSDGSLLLTKCKKGKKKSGTPLAKQQLTYLDVVVSSAKNLTLVKQKKHARKNDSSLVPVHEVISTAEDLPRVKQKKRAKKTGAPSVKPHLTKYLVPEVISAEESLLLVKQKKKIALKPGISPQFTSLPVAVDAESVSIGGLSSASLDASVSTWTGNGETVCSADVEILSKCTPEKIAPRHGRKPKANKESLDVSSSALIDHGELLFTADVDILPEFLQDKTTAQKGRRQKAKWPKKKVVISKKDDEVTSDNALKILDRPSTVADVDISPKFLQDTTTAQKGRRQKAKCPKKKFIISKKDDEVTSDNALKILDQPSTIINLKFVTRSDCSPNAEQSAMLKSFQPRLVLERTPIDCFSKTISVSAHSWRFNSPKQNKPILKSNEQVVELKSDSVKLLSEQESHSNEVMPSNLSEDVNSPEQLLVADVLKPENHPRLSVYESNEHIDEIKSYQIFRSKTIDACSDKPASTVGHKKTVRKAKLTWITTMDEYPKLRYGVKKDAVKQARDGLNISKSPRLTPVRNDNRVVTDKIKYCTTEMDLPLTRAKLSNLDPKDKAVLLNLEDGYTSSDDDKSPSPSITDLETGGATPVCTMAGVGTGVTDTFASAQYVQATERGSVSVWNITRSDEIGKPSAKTNTDSVIESLLRQNVAQELDLVQETLQTNNETGVMKDTIVNPPPLKRFQYSKKKMVQNKPEYRVWFAVPNKQSSYENGYRLNHKSIATFLGATQVMVLKCVGADLSGVGDEQLILWKMSDSDVDELCQQVRREMKHKRTEHIMPLVMQLSRDQIESAYGQVVEDMKTYVVMGKDSDDEWEENKCDFPVDLGSGSCQTCDGDCQNNTASFVNQNTNELDLRLGITLDTSEIAHAHSHVIDSANDIPCAGVDDVNGCDTGIESAATSISGMPVGELHAIDATSDDIGCPDSRKHANNITCAAVDENDADPVATNTTAVDDFHSLHESECSSDRLHADGECDDIARNPQLFADRLQNNSIDIFGTKCERTNDSHENVVSMDTLIEPVCDESILEPVPAVVADACTSDSACSIGISDPMYNFAPSDVTSDAIASNTNPANVDAGVTKSDIASNSSTSETVSNVRTRDSLLNVATFESNINISTADIAIFDPASNVGNLDTIVTTSISATSIDYTASSVVCSSVTSMKSISTNSEYNSIKSKDNKYSRVSTEKRKHKSSHHRHHEQDHSLVTKKDSRVDNITKDNMQLVKLKRKPDMTEKVEKSLHSVHQSVTEIDLTLQYSEMKSLDVSIRHHNPSDSGKLKNSSEKNASQRLVANHLKSEDSRRSSTERRQAVTMLKRADTNQGDSPMNDKYIDSKLPAMAEKKPNNQTFKNDSGKSSHHSRSSLACSEMQKVKKPDVNQNKHKVNSPHNSNAHHSSSSRRHSAGPQKKMSDKARSNGCNTKLSDVISKDSHGVVVSKSSDGLSQLKSTQEKTTNTLDISGKNKSFESSRDDSQKHSDTQIGHSSAQFSSMNGDEMERLTDGKRNSETFNKVNQDHSDVNIGDDTTQFNSVDLFNKSLNSIDDGMCHNINSPGKRTRDKFGAETGGTGASTTTSGSKKCDFYSKSVNKHRQSSITVGNADSSISTVGAVLSSDSSLRLETLERDSYSVTTTEVTFSTSELGQPVDEFLGVNQNVEECFRLDDNKSQIETLKSHNVVSKCHGAVSYVPALSPDICASRSEKNKAFVEECSDLRNEKHQRSTASRDSAAVVYDCLTMLTTPCESRPEISDLVITSNRTEPLSLCRVNVGRRQGTESLADIAIEDVFDRFDDNDSDEIIRSPSPYEIQSPDHSGDEACDTAVTHHTPAMIPLNIEDPRIQQEVELARSEKLFHLLDHQQHPKGRGETLTTLESIR